MINLEEEARKRRERLKSAFSSSTESKTEATKEPEATETFVEPETVRKRKELDFDEDYNVPESEALYDSTGAEIIGLDSKLPDTLEAQVKTLLSPQNDLILNPEINVTLDKNSDLKREYERRMTLLNKQTRRAVVDIVRARLEQEEKEKNSEDEE